MLSVTRPGLAHARRGTGWIGAAAAFHSPCAAAVGARRVRLGWEQAVQGQHCSRARTRWGLDVVRAKGTMTRSVSSVALGSDDGGPRADHGEQSEQHSRSEDGSEETSSEKVSGAVINWLYGCAGMVFGMVVVGGTTRLTNSGLSMVDWKPQGGLPPMNDEEWDLEFEKYKQFPEYQKLNPDMTVEEFKQIYFWEYSHRMMGRLIGVVFTVPFMYFMARRRIPASLKPKLWLMLAMGGSQGFLGWYMVKSGLDEATIVTDYPTVSPYRLAAHLCSAFTIYSFILWTTMSLVHRRPPPLSTSMNWFRHSAHFTTGLVATTVVSGAFVAGLDAGLVYNEFPYMGESIIPKEWGDLSPTWRNFTENMYAVQFNHRALATTTFTAVTALWLSVALRPSTRALMSARSIRCTHALMAMACVQVGLGIATLVHHVPVSLGVIHQSGSLLLLTIAMTLVHSLRRGAPIRLASAGRVAKVSTKGDRSPSVHPA